MKFYEGLGAQINPYVWQMSKPKIASNDLSILDLIDVSRSDSYDKLDERLKAFFEAMTAKARKDRNNKDITWYIYITT